MDDIKITSGIGNPSSPLYGEVLSAEDEKRLDDQGRLIVHGLPWSEAGTGLYLVVAVSGRVPKADRRMIGGQSTDVPKRLCGPVKRNRKITVGSFYGKPAFDTNYAGAAIELPSDLARDELKRQYVIEWIVNTAQEALDLSGVNVDKDKAAGDELAIWLAVASQDAVERTRL